MAAYYLPSILVPLVGLVFPALTMGALFLYIEKEDIVQLACGDIKLLLFVAQIKTEFWFGWSQKKAGTKLMLQIRTKTVLYVLVLLGKTQFWYVSVLVRHNVFRSGKITKLYLNNNYIDISLRFFILFCSMSYL